MVARVQRGSPTDELMKRLMSASTHSMTLPASPVLPARSRFQAKTDMLIDDFPEFPDDLDDLAELADLPRTQPRLPALRPSPHSTPYPQLEEPHPTPISVSPASPAIPASISTTITGRALVVAADFAEYMCGHEYMQSEALASLTIETRMRLFALVGRIYLPALELAQRQQGQQAPDGPGDSGELGRMQGKPRNS